MATLRVYSDENVNPAVSEGLRRRGIDAWCAAEAGRLSLSDEEQLKYARDEQAVLFTHDTDLIVLAQSWLKQGQEHCGVIYVHQDSLSIGECVYRLKDYADTFQAGDMKNCIEYQ